MSDEEVLISAEAQHEEPVKVLSIEDKARQMGWRPLEDYKGDPDGWVDSKEFVSRGSFFRKIDDLKEKLKAQDQILKTVNDTLSMAEKRAYDKAVYDVKAQMSEARLAGDFDAYERAAQQQIQLAQKPVQQVSAGSDPRQAPEWKEFEVQNPWVNLQDADSQIKQSAAAILIKNYRDAHPGCEFKDVTDYVHKEIRAKFVNDFKAPHTAVVAGASRNSSGSVESSSNNYAGLNEAQKQALKYYETHNIDTKELLNQFRKGKK